MEPLKPSTACIVSLAGHVDPVLGALELVLQIEKILVGLEVGVALDDHHQPRQGRR